MAEFHFHGQVIKRSEGRSAVACAAYRAAEALFDERLGLTMSFPTKPAVVHSEIVAPEGAAPWMRDRELLWNAVERAEHRRDAQLAYDYDISLPIELSPAGRLALVRDFVRHEFVRRGFAADFSIHHEKKENPHFHLMVPIRPVQGNGLARIKPRAWQDRRVHLEHLRAAWADAANRALGNEGHRARIDHRSYAVRGIDLEPQPKMFRRQDELERDQRDLVHERSDALLAQMRRNGARLIAHPEIALHALTSKRATFDEHDLARFINRHTADAEQFERAMISVRCSPELVQLRKDERGNHHYSTQTVVAIERRLLADAHLLAQRGGHSVGDAVVEQALERSTVPLSAEQQRAVRHVTQGRDLTIVAGYAGTGKSTMLAAARVAWEGQGYRVLGGALAGRAAEGLASRDAAGIPARTLHAWQWAWEQGRDRLTSRDVFVVDEAAMVGSAQLSVVLDEVRRAGAKVVLVGDIRQLQSIDQGDPMRLLEQRYGAATLTNVVRQRAHDWQRSATIAFATDHADEAIQAYIQHGHVHQCVDGAESRRLMIAAWEHDREANPGDTTLLLALRRRDVRELNVLAREVRRSKGELGPDHRIATTDGERAFSVGDRIFFLRNDRPLGVTNGSLGTIEEITDGQMIVRLDTSRTVVVDTKLYCALDHGYAGTIHKSQGATVDRTYVLASRYMDASATYVALSRHRKNAALFYSQDEFRDAERLTQALSRRRRDPMAHELLDDAQEVQSLAEKVEREELFLAARPADQEAELAMLQQIGAARARSAAELIEGLGEVRAARADKENAERELASTRRELADYEREHPHLTRFGSAGHRDRVRAAEAAQESHSAASVRLDEIRIHPRIRHRAELLATGMNVQIRRAQERWRELVLARQRGEREQTLAAYALEENRVLGAVQMRVGSLDDEHRVLEAVRGQCVAGKPAMILRDPSGCPQVVVDAERWLIRGSNAVAKSPDYLRSSMERDPDRER